MPNVVISLKIPFAELSLPADATVERAKEVLETIPGLSAMLAGYESAGFKVSVTVEGGA